MRSSTEIRNQIAECKAKAEALDELIRQESRDFTDEERGSIDAIAKEIETHNTALDTALKFEAILNTKLGPKVDTREKPKADARKTVPIRFQSSFRKGIFNSAEDAYASGQWLLASIFNRKKSKEYCRENGIRLRPMNTMGTGDNTKGGFLVPEPLANSIIERREQYGVFARYAAPWQMSGPVENVPRVTGDITTYWVGENSQLTASDMTLAGVRLEAKKLTGMVKFSDELNEDSIISLAELISRSVAYKFAYDEDNAGFNGDATSTYGGIQGAENVLLAGSIATATGITTTATLTMAVFENAIGKLKMYPGIQPAWFFHQNLWSNGPQRLLDALGGNNNSDVANGSPMRFKGYPVVISQVLYSGTGATGEVFGYFGDLGMAAYIGRRRGMTMAADRSRYFEYDQIAIKATQRLDINVYDRGSASDSGSLIQLKFG